MSETEPETGTQNAAETAAVTEAEAKTAPHPAKPRRAVWPAVFGVGFLLLAGGEGYLWVQQRARSADSTSLAVLRAQIQDMHATLAVLAKTMPGPDNLTTQANLAQKFAALSAEVNAIQGQVAADHGQISMMQANAINLGALTQRMALLNVLETARMALAAGQPLGTIPGAPPALTRFADTAPPTLAGLRQSFAAAARAAKAASVSANGQSGFWARARARLEGIITVSEGSHVLFGPPATAALNQARAALEAGDLAGAVAALNQLNPPAQAAMQGWLAQAKALLAARQALLSMAQGA